MFACHKQIKLIENYPYKINIRLKIRRFNVQTVIIKLIMSRKYKRITYLQQSFCSLFVISGLFKVCQKSRAFYIRFHCIVNGFLRIPFSILRFYGFIEEQKQQTMMSNWLLLLFGWTKNNSTNKLMWRSCWIA